MNPPYPSDQGKPKGLKPSLAEPRPDRREVYRSSPSDCSTVLPVSRLILLQGQRYACMHAGSAFSVSGGTALEDHGLDLEEGKQALSAALPPDARLLEPAKGQAKVGAEGVVADGT